MNRNTEGSLMNTSKEEEKDHHAHHHHMNCTEVVDRVYAFLDGEMNLDEVLEFKDHLKVCLPCKDYVQFEQRLIQIIKAKSLNHETKIPSDLMEKIKKAIDVTNSSLKS